MPIPMAWSVNESWSTAWKTSFESLKIWAPCTDTSGHFQGLDRKVAWLPMTWPSYLVALRWQLIMGTESNGASRISIQPGWLGFPITALSDSVIVCGSSSVSANIHFMLPSEEVLKKSNPEVPVYDGARTEAFTPWKYKNGSRIKALPIVQCKFRACIRPMEQVLQSRMQSPWCSRVLRQFWHGQRWRIPVSPDSDLEVPLTPESSSDRDSVDDEHVLRMAALDLNQPEPMM